MRFAICSVVTLLVATSAGLSNADDGPSEKDVTSAMRVATAYFREHVAVHGGYVYFYSTDLTQRWGEGVATAEQIWVQPPATPTVGLALLASYEATGDSEYLEAAREAAEALVFGQRRSGGWSNSIDCTLRSKGYPFSGGKQRKEGTTSLDDGQTQSAIQLVARVDQALRFKHQGVHQSATLALDSLLAAQFPNGGFPQVWTAPVSKQPVLAASFPSYDWRTDGRIKNYWDMYTINDNVCGYVADALITAYEVYQEERFKQALAHLGDFLVLAQLPEPQTAWAQQYNYKMHPIWARKFEPPGISGDESQEVIETLMKIYEVTRDPKYLEPIPRALAYLKKSLLPDGRLARYYELQTNKPLYMVRTGKQYWLTYDDRRLPKHYGWKTESRLESLERRYHNVRRGRNADIDKDQLAADARRVIDSLDDQGRWISIYQGERLVGQPKFQPNYAYVSSEVFSHNMTLLAQYLTSMQNSQR